MSVRKQATLISTVALLALVLLLTGCGGGNGGGEPTQMVAASVTPVLTTQATQAVGEATTAPSGDLAVDVPFQEEWAGSAHANAEAPAFTHWNEEDPQEIPAECAKCHSTPGFQDYVGADESAFGEVNSAHPVGTVITCTACHNDATLALNTVRFPSGVELTGLGNEAICMTCHQGTASRVQVDEAIAAAGATDEDTVVPEMGFTNIHYYAAAVTRYGKIVHGGYEYDGKSYDALFEHVEGVSTCVECHDSHTLEVKLDLCAECHEGADTIEGVRQIRMVSSARDYDGDGDLEEPILAEIEGLRTMLYQAIQSYASEVSGTPIVYSTEAYPYFFIDTNADGEAGEDETIFPNRYNAWTPRLEKAAYNFQTSLKDPGQYAHGGKYIIQLLYDSIENLNDQLDTPVDLSTANRIDPGHFAGSEEAWRHWDEDGMVEPACTKCHSAEGLPMFLENNSTIAVAPSNGLQCTSCHSDLSTWARYEVEQVTFPSGAQVSFETPDNNLCLQCHQGRESTVSVNRAIGDRPDDTSDETLRFRNIHYFAAGATLFGTEVKGAYEFEGQQYSGRFMHVDAVNTCTECHDAHALEPKLETCEGCHGTSDAAAIRNPNDPGTDFDGDGDVEEGLAGEIATLEEALWTAIVAYSTDTLQAPIQYNSHAYPYFFNDPNANGQVDEGEEGYASWSPTLLRSAYNYQFAQKDPGDYVHNASYIIQILIDSIENVGGDISGYTRPEVRQQAAEPTAAP